MWISGTRQSFAAGAGDFFLYQCSLSNDISFPKLDESAHLPCIIRADESIVAIWYADGIRVNWRKTANGREVQVKWVLPSVEGRGSSKVGGVLHTSFCEEVWILKNLMDISRVSPLATNSANFLCRLNSNLLAPRQHLKETLRGFRYRPNIDGQPIWIRILSSTSMTHVFLI